MLTPIIISTLGDLKQHGYRASGCCQAHGMREIDIDVMIGRLGENWKYTGRRWPITCRDCGGDLDIIISPIDTSGVKDG